MLNKVIQKTVVENNGRRQELEPKMEFRGTVQMIRQYLSVRTEEGLLRRYRAIFFFQNKSALTLRPIVLFF